MSRLTRFLLFTLGSMVIASLLIACGSFAESAAPTAVPTATPEPPTAEPPPGEILGPADASEVPRITSEELKTRLDNGDDIAVFDTRGESEYDRKHIAGALRASGDYWDYFEEFPHDTEIVLYCD